MKIIRTGKWQSEKKICLPPPTPPKTMDLLPLFKRIMLVRMIPQGKFSKSNTFWTRPRLYAVFLSMRLFPIRTKQSLAQAGLPKYRNVHITHDALRGLKNHMARATSHYQPLMCVAPVLGANAACKQDSLHCCTFLNEE